MQMLAESNLQSALKLQYVIFLKGNMEWWDDNILIIKSTNSLVICCEDCKLPGEKKKRTD